MDTQTFRTITEKNIIRRFNAIVSQLKISLF